VLRTMIQRTGCPPAEGRLLSLWMRPRRALAVAMPVLALFAVAPGTSTRRRLRKQRDERRDPPDPCGWGGSSGRGDAKTPESTTT
jgi:hypothetical protein